MNCYDFAVALAAHLAAKQTAQIAPRQTIDHPIPGPAPHQAPDVDHEPVIWLRIVITARDGHARDPPFCSVIVRSRRQRYPAQIWTICAGAGRRCEDLSAGRPYTWLGRGKYREVSNLQLAPGGSLRLSLGTRPCARCEPRRGSASASAREGTSDRARRRGLVPSPCRCGRRCRSRAQRRSTRGPRGGRP
jgi:hypothetical protein